MQFRSRKRGLGDWVGYYLSRIGITEKRVSEKLGRPCGCGARKEKLNSWGWKVWAAVKPRIRLQ